MQENSQHRCFFHSHSLSYDSLSYETANHTGQYIAHSPTGHPRIAAAVNPDPAIGKRGQCSGSLEDQNDIESLCKVTGYANAIRLNFRNIFTYQTGHLTGMRGQGDRLPCSFDENPGVVRQGVEAIGIN
jgi:hypothetical protein